MRRSTVLSLPLKLVFPGTGHWKSLAGTNALAYSAHSQTTKKMKCCKFGPRLHLKTSISLTKGRPCLSTTFFARKQNLFTAHLIFYISPLTQPIQKTFFLHFSAATLNLILGPAVA
jgi:hypothetical protein